MTPNRTEASSYQHLFFSLGRLPPARRANPSWSCSYVVGVSLHVRSAPSRHLLGCVLDVVLHVRSHLGVRRAEGGDLLGGVLAVLTVRLNVLGPLGVSRLERGDLLGGVLAVLHVRSPLRVSRLEGGDVTTGVRMRRLPRRYVFGSALVVLRWFDVVLRSLGMALRVLDLRVCWPALCRIRRCVLVMLKRRVVVGGVGGVAGVHVVLVLDHGRDRSSPAGCEQRGHGGEFVLRCWERPSALAGC